jgi:hypothetical protein
MKRADLIRSIESLGCVLIRQAPNMTGIKTPILKSPSLYRDNEK